MLRSKNARQRPCFKPTVGWCAGACGSAAGSPSGNAMSTVRMVQIRVHNEQRPYRSIVEVDKGERPDDAMNLRIAVFDRPVPNMTR